MVFDSPGSGVVGILGVDVADVVRARSIPAWHPIPVPRLGPATEGSVLGTTAWLSENKHSLVFETSELEA